MASQSGRAGIQVVGLVILAHLLTPADFGLMALATTISTFAVMFRELGLSSALIQKEHIDGDDIWTAQWIYLVVGIGLAGILAWASLPLSSWLGDGRASVLVKGLAWTFPLFGLGGVQQARLERESRFQTLAGIEIAAAGAGLCTGVAMAVLGHGANSLVGQTLVSAGAGTTLLWLAAGRFPVGRFRPENLKRLAGFGGNLTLFNAVNYFARNADNILVGRRLGSAALGLYAQAYRIMMLPVQNLTFVAGRALLPVLSRERSDPLRFWQRYLDASGVVAVLAAPLLSCLALFRTDLVAVFLGSRWMAVAPLLPWLCFAGALQSLVSLTGTVLIALGKVRLHLLLGTANALLQISSFFLGIRHGLSGLVQAYAGANLFGAALVLGILIPTSRGSYRRYIQRTLPPFALGLACFLLARLLSVRSGLPTGWPSLAVFGTLGGAGYAILLHRFSPEHFQRLARLLPTAGNQEGRP